VKRSLQTGLLWGIGAGSTAVLFVAGTVLYFLIRNTLLAEFDASLASAARALAVLVEQDGSLIESDLSERGLESFERDKRPEYFQLWSEDGKVIERSRQLGSCDLLRAPGEADRGVFEFATLPDGRAGRLVCLPFVPNQEQDSAQVAAQTLTITLARETLPLDQTLARIRVLLACVIGGAVLLSLIVAAPIVRIGLRPLQSTSEQIAQVDSQQLTHRLDPTDAPREVRVVIDCLNGLLGRLDDAFQRERGFSANVAHELRTPLAGLRSTMEVALSKSRDPQEYEAALASCLDMTQQTQTLVDTLLALARIDAGQCEIRTAPVQLDELLSEEWSTAAVEAKSRQLVMSWRVQEGISIHSDPDKLQLVIRNLIDNAVSYTGDGGAIEIAASAENGTAAVVVENTGSRVARTDVERVFDRFWRGDAARTQTDRHSGLGLALCRELAELLDIDLSVDSEQGGRFRVRLGIPSR